MTSRHRVPGASFKIQHMKKLKHLSDKRRCDSSRGTSQSQKSIFLLKSFTLSRRPSTPHVWDRNCLCYGVLFSAALWPRLLKGGKHPFIVLDSIKLDFYRAVKLSLYSQINAFAVHPRLSCCCCPSSAHCNFHPKL